MRDAPYCIAPWFSRTIRTDGKSRPCCAYADDSDIVLDDSFNGSYMNSLRDRFLAGERPRNCDQCAYDDSIATASVRALMHELAEHLGVNADQAPSVRSLEINLSNICNLRCRTCNGDFSTRWIADEIELGWDRSQRRHLMSAYTMDESTAKSVQRILFHGGEPTLHQDEISEILEKVHAAGRLGQLWLGITTNGMVQFTDRLIGLMSKCHRVHLAYSIDGVGKLNDYIRSDSRWETISSNLREMDRRALSLRNIKLATLTTYSVYNANAVGDIWRWTKQFGFSENQSGMVFCINPSWCDARILTRSAKLRVSEKLSRGMANLGRHSQHVTSAVKHLGMAFQGPTVGDFLALNERLDRLRGASLVDANPELWDLLHE